jgi:hypothetical protein
MGLGEVHSLDQGTRCSDVIIMSGIVAANATLRPYVPGLWITNCPCISLPTDPCILTRYTDSWVAQLPILGLG